MKSARYLYVPSVHPPLVLAVVGPWPCGLDPRQHDIVMPLRFHTPGVAVRAFFVVHCIQRFNILLSMTTTISQSFIWDNPSKLVLELKTKDVLHWDGRHGSWYWYLKCGKLGIHIERLVVTITVTAACIINRWTIWLWSWNCSIERC